MPSSRGPQHRAQRLSPDGQACGAPCWEASPAWAPVEPRGPRSDDESCRGGWSNPQTTCIEAEYSRARWSSPAALARTLSPTGQGCRPPRPAPGRSVPLGRLVEPRVQERPRSASVERRPIARHGPPRGRQLRNVHVPTTSGVPPRTPGSSFVRSVRHRGHPRVLVDPCGRPHRPSSPAGATSGPEAGHRHAGATGSIPQAPPDCWKSSTCDAAKSRPSWLRKGRTIYKRPPGGARQPSPASAGRSRIYRRPGRHTARPERRSRPGTPRPPRSSRPPRRDRGSRRGTGKEDLGLSGHCCRVPGTRQNFP